MKFAPANRIPSLDGLRAISILLVIIGHMHPAWVGLAIFGVHIFFVISGYLITTLLQKEFERNGRISLTGFYSRRCFRILPAAYTYILIVALLDPVSRPGLPYAATYTVSYHSVNIPIIFQHLWSLSVEEQFYLLWPLALVFCYRRRAVIAWLAMLVAAFFRLGVALSHVQFPAAYMHFSFPGTMDSIAAGCLLAIYEPQIRERLGWMSEARAIAIALPITAQTLGGLWWGDSPIVGVRCLSALWGAVPLLLALWMFLLIRRQDWVFNNPVASAIGVLSYSIYLWQQPFTVSHPYPKILAAFMLGGCAVGSYFLVERPFLRFGALVNRRKSTPANLTSNVQVTAAE